MDHFYLYDNTGSEFSDWKKTAKHVNKRGIDYYKRTSDGLLVNIDVSSVTGFNSALVNIGEVENTGFELELTTVNLRTDAFTWESTIIGTWNKNNLTDFANNNGLITSVVLSRIKFLWNISTDHSTLLVLRLRTFMSVTLMAMV